MRPIRTTDITDIECILLQACLLDPCTAWSQIEAPIYGASSTIRPSAGGSQTQRTDVQMHARSVVPRPATHLASPLNLDFLNSQLRTKHSPPCDRVFRGHFRHFSRFQEQLCGIILTATGVQGAISGRKSDKPLMVRVQSPP